MTKKANASATRAQVEAADAPRKPRRERRMARAAESKSAGDAPPPTPRPPRKIDQVIILLKRDAGATLPELIEATGWLPHTTRAALTGLRKKGHVIGKTCRDGITVYAIANAA